MVAIAIARWVTQVIARPWTVIAVFAAATGLCGYYAANHLGINTDTADMIARDLPWRQDFIAFREQFPNRFRTIIVVIDGNEAAVGAAAASLREQMLQRPELFLDVYQPLGGEFLNRNALLFLPVSELEALADELIAAQPLLGRLSRDASGANLIGTLTDFIERDASAASQLQPLLRQVTAALDDRIDAGTRRLDWGGLARPGDTKARQVLVVQPVLDFTKPRPGRAAMEALGTMREAMADVSVRFTGSVAMEDEELTSVVRGASLAGILALVFVGAVLMLALRSLRLLVVALVTLVVGLTLTAAFAASAVGHLNLISVAFAVLYIGLGIDFVIHSVLRFQELRGEGYGVAEALPRMARGVGMSLVICAVTTAAGFYAFIPTPFEGVSELGLISGTGMFLSLLVSLTLLPALLMVLPPRRPTPPGTSSSSIHRPNRRWVIGSAVLLTLVSALALRDLRFDNDPLHLREASSESVQTFNALLADERIAPRTLTVLADSATQAQALVREIEALPEVRRVVTPATLVPSNQTDKLFILEDLQLSLGPGFGDIVASAGNGQTLEAALQRAAGMKEVEADVDLADAAAGALRRLSSLTPDLRSAALAELE